MDRVQHMIYNILDVLLPMNHVAFKSTATQLINQMSHTRECTDLIDSTTTFFQGIA